eukprot:782652-Prymnesium_polylepis.1
MDHAHRGLRALTVLLQPSLNRILVGAAAHAAVDAYDGAVDVGARLTHEHQHRPDDLVGVAPPLHRHLLRDALADVQRQSVLRHVGQKGPRANAVDADAVRAQLQGAGVRNAN